MRGHLSADTQEGQQLVDEINAFCEAIRLDDATGGRHSVVFMLDLYFGCVVQGHLNPAKVISEIRSLESPEITSRTKQAEPFKGPLLGGLWHKHHLESGISSLAKNLKKGLHIYGMPTFEQKVREAEEANEERFMTEADVPQIVHDVTTKNYERLADESKLTGEWVIFAKHEGNNYYLCLGKHNSGDEHLRAQIEAVCFAEFPFLEDILPPRLSSSSQKTAS